MKMQNYRDLIAYQKAYQLTLDVYKTTKTFPREELFGLVSQMRRSAVSIPCNIAEGYCRTHRKEYVQFLNIAFGSSVNWKPCYHLQRTWVISLRTTLNITMNHRKIYPDFYGS
jgi:four helix bundle protein